MCPALGVDLNATYQIQSSCQEKEEVKSTFFSHPIMLDMCIYVFLSDILPQILLLIVIVL